MTCLWNDLSLKFPVLKMYFLWYYCLLHKRYANQMCHMARLWIFCLWNDLSLKFPLFKMYCLLHKRYANQMYFIAWLWNFLSVKWPVFEVSCLENVFSMILLSITLWYANKMYYMARRVQFVTYVLYIKYNESTWYKKCCSVMKP